MKTQISLSRYCNSARRSLAALLLGLPAIALSNPTTLFDSNFDNATAGAVTAASGLGVPAAGTWDFVGAPHGGITTDASAKAALFAKNTTTAISWVTAPSAVNTVAFTTSYPNTKTIDANGNGVAVIANLASPGPITGAGSSTTINFNWGQCGTATSGYCKYAFVRGLDAADNEVFELLFSQINPATGSQIYARGAGDSTTTRTAVGAGTPQGTLLINGFGADTSFSVAGSAANTTKPTGMIGVTITLANGQVTYGFSKGTATANPLTYPVNSAATTISKLEFSTISATDASGAIGYWLDNVLVSKVDGATYTVTYDGNSATSGTAPVDGGSPYPAGATVTVLGQGDLAKSGYSFGGWNSQADGLGTIYGTTFTMPAANTTLHAIWLPGTPTITAPPTFPAAISNTYGTASNPASVSVSGFDLAGNIVASAPTGLEISSDGSTFGPTATFVQTGGSAGGTLSVRLKNNAAAGSYDSQNVTLTSLGAAPVDVATTATGNTVATKTLTVTGAAAQDKLLDGTTAAIITGTLSGIENSDAVTLIGTGTFASATAGTWEVTAACTLGGGPVANNYTLTQPTGLSASIIEAAVWTSVSDGSWNIVGNWLNSVIGNGSGTTSDFSTLDIAVDTIVNLTAPATIGHLIFGDTETSATPAGWTLSNNATPANTLIMSATAPTITVNTHGTDKGVTINAVIAGSNGLTKAGGGTLTLGKANSYTGTTVIDGGVLKAGIGNIFAGGTNGTPVVVNASGTLDLNGMAITISSFSGSGTLDNTAATAATLSIGKNNTGGTFSGLITNTGGGVLNLSKYGSSNTTTLSAANTYTGVTKVFGGILSINTIGNVGAGASAVGAPTTDADGTISLGLGDSSTGTQGTLKYTGPTTSTDRIINLSGTTAGGALNASDNTGPITFTKDFTATGTGAKSLTLNGTSTLGNTVAGKIVDSGGGATSLFKAGVGTWIVSADNPYTGTTTVSVGTLIVNGTHSTGGTYTVSSGGTLSGTGTITAAVGVTGVIAPGPGIGTLATGPLSFSNLSTLAVEINTSTMAADKIIVTGDVTRPGANMNLTLADLGSNTAMPIGTKLTLVDYSGTWDVSKTLRFNGAPVPNDSSIVFGANAFTVKYDDMIASGDYAMTLTVAKAPFESWIDGYALQIPLASNRLPEADPDNDGSSNLVEFALNGNPSDGADNGKQVVNTIDSGDAGTTPDLTLTLAVRDGAIASAGPNGSVNLAVDGIVYNIQGSLTLAPPFDSAVSEVTPALPLTPSPDAGWTARTFRLDASDGLSGKGFLRVSISK